MLPLYVSIGHISKLKSFLDYNGFSSGVISLFKDPVRISSYLVIMSPLCLPIFDDSLVFSSLL